MARKKKVLTPEQFAERMREISQDYDTEGAHADADSLMCEILEALGYVEGVAMYRKLHKWYA